MLRQVIVLLLLFVDGVCFSQTVPRVSVIDVDSAWAGNSVNAVVFRKNSLVTYGDTQFIAFYNQRAKVVLGKRKLGSKQWQLKETVFSGNIRDAHNAISIMVDGEGFVHLAWDHHNNPLNYSISEKPLSLEMTPKKTMTGKNEKSVSYPEFYKVQGGNLIFLYRDGGSGKGNLVVNKYDLQTKQWIQLSDNLIDGEGKRNAYWQAYSDAKNVFHISWVWRESPDVASNHDLCYARSEDGGLTWEKSTGEKYVLPVNANSAEYICKIPQRSELINQTSMSADQHGNPVIASYWKRNGSSVPQYHLVYKKNGEWKVQDLDFRTIPFSLSGTGTRRIPISRPQVITWKNKRQTAAAIIFRDNERKDKISVALNKAINKKNKWQLFDLDGSDMGAWEPTYDTELWKTQQKIHLFIQHVEQVSAEGITNTLPQMVRVLEWTPASN